MNSHSAPEEKAFMLLTQLLKTTEENLTTAFDNIGLYEVHQHKKPGGGFRTISEPHESVKEIQRKLLSMVLYKIHKRTIYYRKNYEEANHVFWKDALKHQIHYGINGMIPYRSTKRAANIHCQGDINFITKLDFKSAFPSVKIDRIKEFLTKIFLDDCKAAFMTYKRKSFLGNRYEIACDVLNELGTAPERLPWPRIYYQNKTRYDELEQVWLSWEQRAKEILEGKGYGEQIKESRYRELMLDLQRYGKLHFYESITKNSYPKYSFFSQRRCYHFRELIRDEARKPIAFEDTELPKIIECLADLISQLCCYENTLPQGAPTSGFLLNVVVSETGLLDKLKKEWGVQGLSIFVDDIIISTYKRPSRQFLDTLIGHIEQTGIFKHNPEKVKVYDLRKGSASVLGMKIVKRNANEAEMRKLYSDRDNYHYAPRGFNKAVKKDRPFKIADITLSREKQKRYRAFFHKVISGKGTEKDLDKARGYHGHLLLVYGSHLSLPSALKKTIETFRTMFIKSKEGDVYRD